MSRREFTKKTRREAFKRADGKCEFVLANGLRCNCALTVGKMIFDHVLPDWIGGEPTLENCAVICVACNKIKTAQDAADRAKTQRREDAHRGIKDTPRQRIKSAGFAKAPPQRRASTPLSKTLPPRRSLFGGA